MGCFDISWFFSLLVQIAVVCAIIAIFNIWVWPLLSWLDPRIVMTLKVIVGLVVTIWIIWMVYDLIVCFGGFRLSPGRR